MQEDSLTPDTPIKAASVKGVIIPVHGSPTIVEITSLDSMTNAVGGPIQRLVLKYGAELYVNEEAGIIANPPPVNNRAVLLLAMDAKHKYLGAENIRGPVLLTGATDGEGDITTLPASWYAKLGLKGE